MYQTNEFRRGLKIQFEDGLWTIVECQHVKPGKGVAFVKTRIKNLIDGRTRDINFRSGDKVGRPDVNELDMQVLYQDGEGWHFMDKQTYEQVSMSTDDLGDTARWLKENIEVRILMYNGRAVGAELPNFVELSISKCEPGVRGDTAQGATKPAELETGGIVNVPLFVEEGELIRIDTRTGEYSSRVGK